MVSLGADSYQLAKANVRQVEGGLAQGDVNPMPTKMPAAQVVAAYVEHTRMERDRDVAEARDFRGSLHAMFLADDLACAGVPRGLPVLRRHDPVEAVQLADGPKTLVDKLPGAGAVLIDLAVYVFSDSCSTSATLAQV